MNPLDWLVGGSAALATFVASVMGDEQEKRLRNGTFGAIAGTGMGGFAALLKNQPELLLVGVLGSTLGAFFGWLAYLLLSWIAVTNTGRRIVTYQLAGLQGVLDQMKLDTIEQQMRALRTWGENFRRLVSQQKNELLRNTAGEAVEPAARVIIEGWLTSITDVFNLIFELANEKGHKSRIAIVVFGDKSGKPTGRYWIHYAGPLGAHRDAGFTDESIAYQVLKEHLRSPCFTTLPQADKEGQRRPGGQSYQCFITFRITSSAVMVLDWPGALSQPDKDPRVEIAQNICHQDLTPAIRDTLRRWSRPLAAEVGLNPLPEEES